MLLPTKERFTSWEAPSLLSLQTHLSLRSGETLTLQDWGSSLITHNRDTNLWSSGHNRGEGGLTSVPETDELGLGSPCDTWRQTRRKKKKMEHNLLMCINNQFTSFNLIFMCSFSLWIPADSVWPSLIITSLSLITGHNAKAACQKEPFSPVGTAGALVCLRHTSENDWCEESCQIWLSGFPPLTPPDSRLHVHGWGHRPRPSESGLYCWGWLINDLSRGTTCFYGNIMHIIWIFLLMIFEHIHVRICSQMCVCVCVFWRKRERQKETERHK